MRLIPTMTLAVAGMLLLAVPTASTQEEVVSPEDRDTIEAGPDSLPSEIPGEGAKTESTEEHTVVPGDTLWDLCGQYLNNPWYWPRVWSYNPEISNPHWIFPGQVVRFYSSGELAPAIEVDRGWEVPEPVPEEEEIEDVGRLVEWGSKRLKKVRGATAVMLKRDAFVTQEEVDHLGVITASREEKKYLSEYDSIYIEFKDKQAAQVGQEYMIIRTVRKIDHPVTGEFVGYYTRVLGTAQVKFVDEHVSTALITSSLLAIHRGDRIMPLIPAFKKHVAPKPNSVELRGYIVDARVIVTNYGERHLVFIDQGTDAGVQEGNVFDCVRREDGYVSLGDDRGVDHWDEKLPVEIYGRIMIVDARARASTGIVLASMRELHAGDRVIMSMK